MLLLALRKPMAAAGLLTLLVLAFGGPVAQSQPPAVSREFRAAWIATVANIDWPSKPGLSPQVQRDELTAMLDRCVALRLNAVILQVRPACDALYASQLEPWSEYLTGQMGLPPADGYDPLEFAVAQAHARGLELHAWFNPFRASHPTGKSDVHPQHVSRQHPDWVVQYGDYTWLDPGNVDAAEFSIDVMIDVVARYDIDAVHLDDYFYPYPIANDGKTVPFPDDASWDVYVAATTENDRLARDDWRRENVNRFVRTLHNRIQATRPEVRLGISPFGIYRPGQPASIKGFDAYANLYADSRLWLTTGWVDYLAPQLYWPIEQQPQSFPVLLDWWRQQNPHQRHIWPGLFTSQVRNTSDAKGWAADQIVQQINLTRDGTSSPGHAHFSAKALVDARDSLATRLVSEVYQQPALVPATPWLATEPVSETPTALPRVDGKQLQWPTGDVPVAWLWVLQWQDAGDWKSQIIPGDSTVTDIPTAAVASKVVYVTAVDRLGRVTRAVPIAIP